MYVWPGNFPVLIVGGDAWTQSRWGRQQQITSGEGAVATQIAAAAAQ